MNDGWPNRRSIQVEAQLCAEEVLRRVRPLASGVKDGVDHPRATLEQIAYVRRELDYFERVLRKWIEIEEHKRDSRESVE